MSGIKMGADDARKLFVGGVSDSVGEAELRSLFEASNFSVEYVAIPRDRETGKVRGFGFVTLGSPEEVTQALARLNGTQLGGRSLSMRPFSQEAPKRGEGRPQRGPEPSLFLGKLPYDASEAEISALFEAQGVGPVVRVTLPLGPDGRPRGFGFVTLGSDEAANEAIEKLNGAQVRGRPIVVSKAEPKGRGPGGGGPGGPRSDAPPRRDFGGPPRDFGGGGGPSYGAPSYPPPDEEGRGGGGGGGGGRKGGNRGGGAANASGRRDNDRRGNKPAQGARDAGRGPRGGGGNWHRWEEDD
ncbi:MAG TPA: hypothetical protein VLC09_07025 [Polyangiaceae bacterium]|nr:hypothetical protein [Polyangiaceae bacterium]